MTDSTSEMPPIARRWPERGGAHGAEENLALVVAFVDAVASAHAAREPFGDLSRESVSVGADGLRVAREVASAAPNNHWTPPDAAESDAYQRDVFAVGMAAYELLTGEVPEAARSRRTWRALSRRTGGWPAIGNSDPSLPIDVRRVLDQALGPAERRPSNAVVLRALLRTALPEVAAQGRPDALSGSITGAHAVALVSGGGKQRARGSWSRHLGRLVLISAAVAAVGALAVFGMARRDRVYVPACDSDADCASGLVCFDGWCGAPGFALVPPGTLTVGASPGEHQGRWEPTYEARVTRPVYVQLTEVTQGEWTSLMGTRPAWFAACGDECPVESVSWYEAVEYVNAMSRRDGLEECYALSGCVGELGAGCPDLQPAGDGTHSCPEAYECAEVAFAGLDCRGYRLPTELEWEHASRAGTTTSTYAGPFTWARGQHRADIARLEAIAVTPQTAAAAYHPAWPCAETNTRQPPAEECGPARVAGRAPNALGIHDSIGNVAEWTHDAWAGHPAIRSPRDCRGSWIDRIRGGGPRVGADGSRPCRVGDVRDTVVDAPSGDRAARGGSWYNRIIRARASARFPVPPETRWLDVGFRVARTALPPR